MTHWTQMPVKSCEVCGGPVRSETGVCRKTQQCKREFWRRNQAAKRGGLLPSRPCSVCGHPTWSKYGVCAQTEACSRENRRLSAQAMLLTADRKCRDFGRCGSTANLRSHYCTGCASEANKRHKKARRSALVQLLGDRQEWVCTWCDAELPDDPAAIDVDHIIPKASGLVIEEDWNLQLLHPRCNGEKFNQVTAQALDLAVGHGLHLSMV